MSTPFIIERVFNADPGTVWKAITDKSEMNKWYFDLTEFEPKEGFEFSFTAGDDGKQYLHLCKVTEVVPGKKISYDWRYDGYEGNSNVSFELFPENGKTRIRLTHRGLDTFPTHLNPDLDPKNFEAGWTEIIGSSLKKYLEG